MKRILGKALFFVLVAALASTPALAQKWKATKTITLIIPWGAGGASDLTARVVAGEMERPLGAKIAVINQPGASGSTGTQYAFDMPHDGYTWTGNADASVATYQVDALTPKISHTQWQAYLAMKNPAIICVNPKSPIRSWDDLVNAFKTRDVSVASAGVGAGGHIAAETVKKALGINYKHVPYAGGNPAVIATVSGECEVIMQLSMEEADMIRAKKLIPIAVMSPNPLVIDGYGTIPSANQFVPSMPSVAFNFGLFIPRDIPADAKAAIAAAFDTAARSKAVLDLAKAKACEAVDIQGTEADTVMNDAASVFGWLKYDAGVSPVNPQSLGIPRL
ncbi:MAG TPA: tripartite tricarboxylate transporter substrate binding protein [Rectinemataceae bacterium]|nr:tripartite tricarboxylate transporter substrate binding protein [Rectinemataceae bacterium]